MRSSARAAPTGDARERSGPARAQLANADHLLDEAAAARTEASELERRLGFVRAALRTLRTKSR